LGISNRFSRLLGVWVISSFEAADADSQISDSHSKQAGGRKEKKAALPGASTPESKLIERRKPKRLIPDVMAPQAAKLRLVNVAG
jgi:hypothetical protein